MPEMTYEELIGEIGYRIEELGGVGKHATPEAAEKAAAFAAATLAKLEAAVMAAKKELEVKGYECYLAE